MTTDKILILARKHLGSGYMEDSARIAMQDAIFWKNNDNDELCRYRALKSLKFSLGIHHKDYIRASK